jgi:hypothetical protein
MRAYGSRGGNRGVSHYEIGPNFIHLRFRHDPRVYVYTDKRPGLAKVLLMQHLAVEGEGLTAFVHQHVAGDYERWFVPAQSDEHEPLVTRPSKAAAR